MLYVTLGERSDTPMRPQAQQLASHMGKILRVRPDGTAPSDNPFAGRAGALPEIWSLGHRNVQAAAMDASGRLWEIEHGTRGGDELNLVEKGKNYGWPLAAYGIEYGGGPIRSALGPAATTRPGTEQAVYYWDPVIAPSGATFYTGSAFPQWRGNLFVGALGQQRLVRLVLDGRRVVRRGAPAGGPQAARARRAPGARRRALRGHRPGARRAVEGRPAALGTRAPGAPRRARAPGVPPALTLRAGPDALALVRARGLRAEDVDVVPGASGGAKWLALAGLDRYLFGEFLRAPRDRPLHGIGSSIGSWRLACLAQRDPAAALERGHHAYVHEQQYSSPRPTPAEVSGVLGAALDRLLGATGVDEALAHPWVRLHVITAEARGAAASARRGVLIAAFGAAAAGNLLSRRTLAWQLTRCVFHSAGDATPFAHLADLPTVHRPLTRANLRAALQASGSIPLLMEGVRVPGAPGLHWDGGTLDYHLALDFGPGDRAGDGLVLYPHFYPHVVPGWFDKGLAWRRAAGPRHRSDFRRVLLVAPSDAFVAALPGGKIPDRRDFYALQDAERVRRWQAVVDASAQLGDELRELVATGRVAEAVRAL
jgi:hypothetical protein